MTNITDNYGQTVTYTLHSPHVIKGFTLN